MFRIDAPISALNVAEELLHPVASMQVSYQYPELGIIKDLALPRTDGNAKHVKKIDTYR